MSPPPKRPQDLTPRAIVEELDRYIVGQKAAKRAVAVALRNRWRRQQVQPPMRDEIAPKNIMLIGPTGVGKTEIARRLARLAGAPFVKVEASKFTEVGYVGRDVDSMVRDLAETAVSMLRDEERERLRPRARENAEERLLDVLLPPAPRPRPSANAGGHDVHDRDAAAADRPQPRRGRRRRGAARARQRHAREPAQAAARGEAQRSHGRDRHRGRAAVVHRRLLGHRHGRDGAEPARHDAAGGEAHEAAAPAGQRGVRRADRGRGRQADRHGAPDQGRDPPRRAGRDHLHRRDRQGRGPRGRRRPRPRRVTRGRAARSAADRRGLDGVDEVRSAQDRSRAVHRGRRVPRRRSPRT